LSSCHRVLACHGQIQLIVRPLYSNNIAIPLTYNIRSTHTPTCRPHASSRHTPTSGRNYHDHRSPLTDWNLRGNVDLQRLKRRSRPYTADVAQRS
jgi:hypothetical protein